MPYFALIYAEVCDAYVEKRATHREAHLKLARESFERGELLLAGALADPVDGALLVFQANGPEVVEAFVRSDPYVCNGLVRRWSIRTWNVVVGNAPHPCARKGESAS